MGKVRVYSLAQELDVKSQELLDLLKEMNQEVPSHMSAIDDEIADQLRDKIKGASAAQESKKPEQSKQETKPELKPDTRQESKTLEQPKTEPKKFDQPKHEQPKRDARPLEGRKDGNPAPEGRRDARPAQEAQVRPVSQEQRRDSRPAFQDKKEKPQPAASERSHAQSGGASQSANRPQSDMNRKDKDREKTALKERSFDGRNGRQGTHSGGHGRKNHKHESRPARSEESKYAHSEVAEEVSAVVKNDNVIELQLPLTVKSFAEHLHVAPNQIIAKLIGLGVMATINQNLDSETIELLAADFGKEVVFKSQEEQIKSRIIEDRPEDLQPRPPIVTIMGHVDHGKTSLLDVIRHTNVTATEAGGITQHIGAYQAMINGKKITFLDTPGHEAFTAMRARGAQLTDIAILVVAADDGVMPQTIEAINHAKAAGIQIIVAVNKIDKDNANPDRVLQELTEHGLIAEAWGGDTICVYVSALKKQNIDSLLEMILLVSEMQELKANPNRPADGIVVEALLDKGRGPVATILVKRGTLRIGDPIIAGSTFGRVRAMISDKGERVEKATPSSPVVVLGLNDVPSAGDVFEVVDDDKKARSIADERSQRKRAEELQSNRAVTLDDLFKQIKEGEVKDLNLIIKADVQGSIEALRDSLLRLSTDEVRVSPIHTGVGAVNESDVMLASASNAIIIGFNVRPDLNAQKLAEQSSVEIRTYRIIYQAIDEVKLALEGLLDPEEKEVVTGRATVRAVFKVPKLGAIAGLYITDGKINRNSKVRLLRNGVVIHEGKIGSLKRFQDDVKEVMQGYECGLGIEGYNDIKEGDEIEVFVIEEVRRTLD